MAASAPRNRRLARGNGRRSSRPAMYWLQVGAAAAGVGMALAAAPAIASADDGGASQSTGSSVDQHRRAAASDAVRQRPSDSPGRAGAAVSNTERGSQVHAPRAAALKARAAVAPADAGSQSSSAAPMAAVRADSTPAVTAVNLGHAAARAAAAVSTVSAAPTASAVAGNTEQVGPFGQISAFFGLPGAPATSAPSLGAFPILVRLTLDDLFSGTAPATVANPTAVVTGLFNEVLRKDPTADELQNYLGVLAFTGVNGVVAGLYSSTAFRQTEVDNYYLELLGRNATQRELDWGTTRLMWGLPEPLFAAEIAGSDDFYQASSAGGTTYGVSPSAVTFVDNLYRTLLGTTADPVAANGMVQQLQAGMSTELAAWQFVTTDAFRQAKVQEIYSVLGQTASQAEITSAVQNWFWDGGLAGIATGLLATASNVTRIEAGQVVLPDMTAAAELTQILLASYTSTEDGFVRTLNTLLNVDENNPCTPSSTTCNQALYSLLTTGGPNRGLSNSAITITYGAADVATLIPTQNEIDLAKSLKFPLRDPDQLATFFAGGVITPFGNPVVTSDNGAYIVDGHHRWSAIYLINPFTQVDNVDIGYVPSPQTGLKETQVGVAAQLGYLKVSTGGGINVYTCTRQVFDDGIADFINNNPDPAKIPLVYGVFTTNLGLDPLATDAEKLVSIQNYLWTNVQRMRALNPFIPGATNREVMPQAEPLTPILAFMGSGLLSYSFPIVSYLG